MATSRFVNVTDAEINNFKENATPSTKDATKFRVKLFQGKQRILVNFILYKSVLLLTIVSLHYENLLFTIYSTEFSFFTYVIILKQLFSVIIGEYLPRLRLGEYSLIITSPSANNC